MNDDPFDLQRFLWAQQSCYSSVCRELADGRKTGHWMWFIFPQVAGLGRSATARRYAIQSRQEAVAYLEHPELGNRLSECCRLLLKHREQSARSILGGIDAMKLHSSMTLFASVSDQPVFGETLAAFYNAQRDAATLSILEQWAE